MHIAGTVFAHPQSVSLGKALHICDLQQLQDRLLAAVVVCGCDASELNRLDASQLLTAFRNCSTSTSESIMQSHHVSALIIGA